MNLRDLHEWCAVPAERLQSHPALRIRFRLVNDAAELGRMMAGELADLVESNNSLGRDTRAIVPCGPACWYRPFVEMVNGRCISLRRLDVFHMDECLDWQGRPLPREHPYSFRGCMEREFYADIDPALAVPEEQRHWLLPDTADQVRRDLQAAPVDLTLGGWGQDGHVAYNQARRSAFSSITVEDLENSTIRIQENNPDTIIALAQRTFGGAYQFVPPMSVTLGMRECLCAAKIRLFSDTGAWKQTALRVALFSPPTTEYPITLLQRHPDALIAATRETARHPISENPQWDLL
jgi:glucosamine-6-phosphate deaminase